MRALQFNISIPRYIILKMLGAINKDVYYKGAVASIKLVEKDKPVPLNGEWVLIKTKYCGFCGSDLNLIMLRDSPMATPFTSFPCIIGHEIYGIVQEGGKTPFKKGDRVVISPSLSCSTRGIDPVCHACKIGSVANCENVGEGKFSPGLFTGICHDINGGFAEYIIAHKSQVFPVPSQVSDKSAVLTEPFSVGLQAIYDSRPDDDDHICVIGSGVMGLMIIQAIRGLKIKAHITVLEPSEFHAKKAIEYGADEIIKGDFLEQSARITHGKVYKPMFGPRVMQGGFDKVYDTVGSSKTFSLAIGATRVRGTVSIIGIGRHLSFDPTPLWLKLITVKGTYGYGYVEEDGKTEHIFNIALELLKQHPKIEDMVTHVFSIDQYQEMIKVNLEKGKNRAIKTIVEF
ncbi:MAG: zinc-dependent alcohol dehydrogenase [bacterium]